MRRAFLLWLVASLAVPAYAQLDERLRLGGSYQLYAGLRLAETPDVLVARTRADLRLAFDYDRGRIVLRPRLDYDALGERLAGVIFEQEYARVRESPEPAAFVAELDRFFAEVPPLPYHLEVRSPHLLSPLYTDWLAANGLGFVFSHWTWLPSLQAQWKLVGERFSSGDGEAILRLLNPREMKYAAAFAHAYPFTDAVPELSQTAQARTMINEATALAYKAIEQGVTLFTIANNRAWGNSPKLAQALSRRFLDFADRYGV